MFNLWTDTMVALAGYHAGQMRATALPVEIYNSMGVPLRSVASGALCLLILVGRFSFAQEARRPNQPAEAEAQTTSIADQVLHDLCGKRVALLGEPPMHGFAKTLQFKVEVARRLVDECHYNAFFIESGAYDFLNIQKALKSGQTVTVPMVAAAIGGLWANREVEPLIRFLLDKAQRGVLVLGGLDDQLGRGSYAQLQMPADLVEYLDADDKVRCLAILQKHTLWQYSSEAPYSPKDKALILGCLDRMEPNLSPPRASAARDYDLAMIENLKRSFARDFKHDVPFGVDLNTQDLNDRDQSMYMNFRWLMSRLPADSKVIVWTATSHAAKDLSGVPGQEKIVSLGSYIRRDFKGEAFVLGTSAYSGTYGMARQPVRQLAAAPANSLEGQAFDKGGSDTGYLNASQIREFGSILARPLGPDFKTANWGDVLDGLVIFREERPPLFSGR
jgi:erythromycin esterase-like protein